MINRCAIHHNVYLSLGSNLHIPKLQLAKALTHLNLLPKTRLQACAPFHFTQAVGYINQPNFANTAVHLVTELTPLTLLYQLQKIEETMGRRHSKRWGPRIIDIDILLYGKISMCTEILTIPHPCLYSRSFFLKPLMEIYQENTASFNQAMLYAS